MAECCQNAIAPAHADVIRAARPELRGAPLVLNTDGWDCLAIELDGRFIYKVPHHEAAAERLRREPRALDIVRPRSRIAVPRMRLLDAPFLISEHEKLAGVTVDPDRYATLSEDARSRLAADLAGFFADIHTVSTTDVESAACDALRPWAPGREHLARIGGRVAAGTFEAAAADFAAHERHGPDLPVFGQFDTHGWNMAYDLATDRLNGLFDFAGAGVGGLHRDLSYPLFVSPDLADRVIALYRAATGRPVDRERVYDAHGALRAIELCDETAAGGDVARFAAALHAFAALRR